MPTDFKKLVVGKKYKLNRQLGGYYSFHNITFECLYSGPNFIIMSRPNGTEWALYYEYNHHLAFDEYTEPRKEYFNAYKNPSGEVEYGQSYLSKEIADTVAKNRTDYYGRLIMTHHSETHVDVEFHLKRGK